MNETDIDAADLPSGDQEGADDPLLACLQLVTGFHGDPQSGPALTAGLPLEAGRLTPALLVRAAERKGYAGKVLARSLGKISNLVLPCILLLDDGGACVLLRTGRRYYEVALPESGGQVKRVKRRDLASSYAGYAIFLHPEARVDARVEETAPRSPRFWFWGTLWRFRSYYTEAVVAAVLVNVLALATALFVMNVYDRVVPNDAKETLFVLALGTLGAIGFDFFARSLRGYFLDLAGRKADQILSARIFEHVMGLRMAARPESAGATAAQLREFESVREFMTSATLASFSDVPFVLLFLFVIAQIGAPVHTVLVLAIPLVILVGMLAQIPLAFLMRQHMREATAKHGLLVEAIEGVETLKSMRAEGAMQRKWEDYTALTGRSAVWSRMVASFVVNFSALVAQCSTVAIIVWGVYLIGDGDLTVGGLIACVILTGRAMGPLSQVAGLLTRYQQSRVALQAMGKLMARPIDRTPGKTFLHRPDLRGGFELKQVSFGYPGQPGTALHGVDLRIAPGERVAVLGKVGSGKSTLLRLLSGLYEPGEGALLLDGTDIRQIDPADVRRSIGYVDQEVRLFYGSLRDNLTLGAPFAGDEALLRVARIVGLDSLVNHHPAGFDLPVAERGTALSGGQRQAVGIARALLPSPAVLLLDEPTSAMDFNTEQSFLDHLKRYAEGRTLVLVTHKPSMLGLVERIVVLDGGRIVTDGPRDVVLRALMNPVEPGQSAPAQRVETAGGE